MRVLIRLAFLAVLAFTLGCQRGGAYLRYLIPISPKSKNPGPVNHQAWDELLKKHVNAQGLVNYRGFQADSLALNAYLQRVSDQVPGQGLSETERLAYWLNAYNAFTIQRVIRSYPIKSIRQLGGEQTLVNTVWDQPFIRLGVDKYSLNDIEHRLIRKKFADNRIHFALVCAAHSCPKLRNEAYVATRLNQQLDEQGRDFVNDPAKNQLTPADNPRVSAIFDFYPGDFRKNGSRSVPEVINRYATTKIDPDATLMYLDYDWTLNEQP
jgi:hypothetical protein